MFNLITTQIKHDGLKSLFISFLQNKKELNFAKLTMIHHQIYDRKNPEILKLAAAVELLILSFDILDDLEDLDNMEEPWMKMDHSIALNAATTLYTLSQQSVLALSSPYKHQILASLLKYSLQAMEGQHDDLENRISTEEECLQVMKMKSGSLIALASVCGMQLAGEEESLVEEYAYQIGIAAQTDNDFRDLFNPLKNDIKIQKQSLAFLYLQRKYNEDAIDLLDFYQSGKEILDEFGSIENYKQKLLDSGVMQYLNVVKQIALNRASRMIDNLNIKNEYKDFVKSNLITNKTK
ncbi:polyprenyl synthetase family protein [Metabacillus litoralis]|uniref:polyprenyl synthetase family protein n=1 Tax=Metabacillus litoralis TaxID=152268 RepID=UPI001CFE193C|nr:polyprenyl synthetase family protein [Metabacillus litoralis]